MKYLSIYEKFDSPIINKTFNFLEKKINKQAANNFIDALKFNLGKKLNFPISKLEDSDIKYLKKDKALEVKKENPSKLDYLKFWFSLELGYMFVTGTGDKRCITEKNRNIIYDKNIIQRVKSEIKTGIIKPVINYKNLKHLDKVVGIFSDSKSRRFCKGTIWIERTNIFVIQDCSTGGSPSYNDWMQYGSDSWNIGKTDGSHIGGDHNFLHLYEENDLPLEIINPDDTSIEENVYTYNLYYEDELNDRYSIMSQVKNADFALIISVNDLLNKNLSVDDVRKTRSEYRKDALYLIDDEVLRRINIQRYTKEIFKKFGISDEGLDLNNLEKIITKLILRDVCFYNIICSNNQINYMNSIIEPIKRILRGDDPYEIKNDVKKIYNYYEAINDYYRDNYNRTKLAVQKMRTHAKENDKPTLTEILDIFDKISYKVYNSINEDKISNIYDFNSYLYKLTTLSTMFNNYFKYDIRNLFRYMVDSYDLENNLRYLTEDDFKNDIEKAKSIERYVNKSFI